MMALKIYASSLNNKHSNIFTIFDGTKARSEKIQSFIYFTIGHKNLRVEEKKID